MSKSSPQRKAVGSVLVALQFGLLSGLAASAYTRNHAAADAAAGSLALAAWLLVGAAVALTVWTFLHNKPGNFNIRPAPKDRGQLITSGPYRWIRHPMYTSVLLGGLALALISRSLAGWLMGAALALVLLLKSSLEERWMHEQHPGYAAYGQQSKRFLPWFF